MNSPPRPVEAVGRGITQPRAYLFDHTVTEKVHNVLKFIPQLHLLRKPSAKEAYDS